MKNRQNRHRKFSLHMALDQMENRELLAGGASWNLVSFSDSAYNTITSSGPQSNTSYSIRALVQYYNKSYNGDGPFTIQLGNGTYTLSETANSSNLWSGRLDNQNIYGDIDINPQLTTYPLIIQGAPGGNSTITCVDITGTYLYNSSNLMTDPLDRLFQVLSGSLQLQNVKLTNGLAWDNGNGEQATDSLGGAVLVNPGGSLSLTNCVVRSNFASATISSHAGSPGLNAAGGGIYGSAGSMISLNGNNIFKKNRVIAGRGGTSTNNSGTAGGNAYGGGLALNAGVSEPANYSGTEATLTTTLSIIGDSDSNTQFNENLLNSYYNSQGQTVISGGTGGAGTISGGNGGNALGAGLYVGSGQLNLDGGSGKSPINFSQNQGFYGKGYSTQTTPKPGANGTAQGGGAYLSPGQVSVANSTTSGGILQFSQNLMNNQTSGIAFPIVQTTTDAGYTTANGPWNLRTAVFAVNPLASSGMNIALSLPSANISLVSSSSGKNNGSLQIANTGSGSVTLNGNGQTSTIINGSGVANSILVLNQANVTLQNLTITGANTATNGGAINQSGGTTTLSNIKLSYNKSNNGGAYYSYGGCLTMSGGSAVDNSSPGSGGAFFLDGGMTASFSNVTIANNTACTSAGYGGGIFQDSHGQLTITGNSQIVNNQAAQGGGLYITGTTTINSGNISTNSATQIGGGFVSSTGGIVNLTSVSVASNRVGSLSSPAGTGGGIYQGNASLNLKGSTIIQKNSAANGGGVYSGNSKLISQATKFIGNLAVTNGGGLCMTNGGTATLNSAAFSNNSGTGSSNGGGIFQSGGTLNIKQSSAYALSNTGNWSSSSTSGQPALAQGELTLTDNVGGYASYAWLNSKVSTGSFNISFIYQASGAKAADGIALAFQNQGTNALGGTGGSLGYTGITGATAAYQINLYNGHTQGSNFVTNNTTGNYLTTGSVSFNSGDPIAVNLVYNATAQTVTESLTDLNTAATFSRVYSGINLASILGSSAYLGFTGADGGAISTQTITNFNVNFSTAPAASTIFINNSAQYGGGLYSEFGTTYVDGGLFLKNSAHGNGGGICSWDNSISLSNIVVQSNVNNAGSATEGWGGGIYQNGGGTLSLANVTVANNSSSYVGGGIYSGNNMNATNSQISHNTANNSGGGIFLSGSNNYQLTSVSINSNRLNSSTASAGGGLYVYGGTINASGLNVSNNSISGSSGTILGAGIYAASVTLNFNSGNNYINNNSLNSSTEALGGGIYMNSTVLNQNAGLSISNNTISCVANSIAGTGVGGGLAFGPSCSWTGSTAPSFSGNSASAGGNEIAFNVSNTNDSTTSASSGPAGISFFTGGSGSLRAAVTYAQNWMNGGSGDPNSIAIMLTTAYNYNYKLSTGQQLSTSVPANTTLTIIGTGGTATIQGYNNRTLYVGGSGSLVIQNVNICGGYVVAGTNAQGGGIYQASGTVTLNNMLMYGNQISATQTGSAGANGGQGDKGGAGGTGGSAYGGAYYLADGILNLTSSAYIGSNSESWQNTVTGASGGAGGAGGSGGCEHTGGSGCEHQIDGGTGGNGGNGGAALGGGIYQAGGTIYTPSGWNNIVNNKATGGAPGGGGSGSSGAPSNYVCKWSGRGGGDPGKTGTAISDYAYGGGNYAFSSNPSMNAQSVKATGMMMSGGTLNAPIRSAATNLKGAINILLELHSADGTLIATTATNQDGSFRFRTNFSGPGYIQHVSTPGYKLTPKGTSAGGHTSHFDPQSLRSDTVQFLAGVPLNRHVELILNPVATELKTRQGTVSLVNTIDGTTLWQTKVLPNCYKGGFTVTTADFNSDNTPDYILIPRKWAAKPIFVEGRYGTATQIVNEVSSNLRKGFSVIPFNFNNQVVTTQWVFIPSNQRPGRVALVDNQARRVLWNATDIVLGQMNVSTGISNYEAAGVYGSTPSVILTSTKRFNYRYRKVLDGSNGKLIQIDDKLLNDPALINHWKNLLNGKAKPKV